MNSWLLRGDYISIYGIIVYMFTYIYKCGGVYKNHWIHPSAFCLYMANLRHCIRLKMQKPFSCSHTYNASRRIKQVCRHMKRKPHFLLIFFPPLICFRSTRIVYNKLAIFVDTSSHSLVRRRPPACSNFRSFDAVCLSVRSLALRATRIVRRFRPMNGKQVWPYMLMLVMVPSGRHWCCS